MFSKAFKNLLPAAARTFTILHNLYTKGVKLSIIIKPNSINYLTVGSSVGNKQIEIQVQIQEN